MTDELPLIAQVSNVSSLATLEQMKKLFGYLGKIKDIKIYPSAAIIQPQFKVCYIKYAESWSVRIALHLTNTVFIDRALVVVAIPGDNIPSEDNTSFDLLNPVSALPGLLSSGKDISNEIAAVNGNLVITSTDTNLDILGLPQYPPLSADHDPNTIEEIRRTVYIENINPQVTANQLLDFINAVVGEIKYLRMAGLDANLTQSAFVEFSDRASIVKALQCDGITLKGNKLKIMHSNSAILKPQKESDTVSEKDTEEAMKRLKEAESLIARVVEPEIAVTKTSSRTQKRSTSRSRKRSTSRSRKRSTSRSRKRSTSCSRKRSTSRSRKRSTSRSRKRSTSRSRKRSTSRSRKSSSYSRRNSSSRSHRRSESHSRKHSPPLPQRSRSKSPAKKRKRSHSRDLLLQSSSRRSTSVSRKSRSSSKQSHSKTKRSRSRSKIRHSHSRSRASRSRSGSKSRHIKRRSSSRNRRSLSKRSHSKRRSSSRTRRSRSRHRSRSGSKVSTSKRRYRSRSGSRLSISKRNIRSPSVGKTSRSKKSGRSHSRNSSHSRSKRSSSRNCGSPSKSRGRSSSPKKSSEKELKKSSKSASNRSNTRSRSKEPLNILHSSNGSKLPNDSETDGKSVEDSVMSVSPTSMSQCPKNVSVVERVEISEVNEASLTEFSVSEVTTDAENKLAYNNEIHKDAKNGKIHSTEDNSLFPDENNKESELYRKCGDEVKEQENAAKNRSRSVDRKQLSPQLKSRRRSSRSDGSSSPEYRSDGHKQSSRHSSRSPHKTSQNLSRRSTTRSPSRHKSSGEKRKSRSSIKSHSCSLENSPYKSPHHSPDEAENDKGKLCSTTDKKESECLRERKSSYSSDIKGSDSDI